MTNKKFLLVGQGLAGTLLAHFLLERGQSVMLIDNVHRGAASSVAAGLINPVTGRRIVKTWMIDSLLPVAKESYLKIENIINAKLWHELKIIKILESAGEQNDWQLRASLPEYQNFINECTNIGHYQNIVHHQGGFAQINQCARVDIAKLITTSRQQWKADGILMEDFFNYFQIIDNFKSPFVCNGHQFDTIVFCEGAQAVINPLLSELPFVPAKGECMIIKITKDKLEHEVVDTAIKQQVTLIPIGEGHYWAGSSNEWNAPDNLPSNKVKKELVQKINNILSVDYEIIEHKAAIRPTVKDRRPILGEVLPNIYIFNGLGTKGASLGPYWARCLVAHLLDGESINQEVNVNRFFKK